MDVSLVKICWCYVRLSYTERSSECLIHYGACMCQNVDIHDLESSAEKLQCERAHTFPPPILFQYKYIYHLRPKPQIRYTYTHLMRTHLYKNTLI